MMKIFEKVDKMEPTDLFYSLDEEESYVDKIKVELGVEDIRLAMRAKCCEDYLSIVRSMLDNPSPDRRTKRFQKYLKKVLRKNHAFVPSTPVSSSYSELERTCLIVEKAVQSFVKKKSSM